MYSLGLVRKPLFLRPDRDFLMESSTLGSEAAFPSAGLLPRGPSDVYLRVSASAHHLDCTCNAIDLAMIMATTSLRPDTQPLHQCAPLRLFGAHVDRCCSDVSGNGSPPSSAMRAQHQKI